MLTLSMIFTAASLIMHGVKALLGSNSTVDEITKAVDTGTALTGGAVANPARPTQDATQKVTTSTLPNGTVVRDHRG